MRSTMFKTALAAILISTPLTAAFAGSSPSTYVPNGQLNAVLTDLSYANARIAQDRSQKLMTPAQAHGLRVEVASIRKEAVAANEDGRIPMRQYMPLMAQVENLQGQLFGPSYVHWGSL